MSAEIGAGEAGQAAGAGEGAGAGAARPVAAGERVVLLDVLRGFALGGVFLSNLYMWHSGAQFMPMERAKEIMARPLNVAISHGLQFFVFGRFMAIFTFLFGLGFTILIGRAEARGAPAGRVYARRLGVLALIGFAHMLALWYGDILHLYALIGLTLLLWRRVSDRALLAWGLALTVLGPPLGYLCVEHLPRLWQSAEAAAAREQASMAHRAAWQAQAFADFTSGSWLAQVRANAVSHSEFFLHPRLVAPHLGVLGKFLLGAYFGRRRLLHDVTQSRPLFRRILGWGLAAGVACSLMGVALRVPFVRAKISPESLWPRLVMPWINEIGMLGLAAAYVAAIALMFQRPRLRRALSLLAPAGQMALTNYIGHSVFSVLIFTGLGLGLLGKVEPLQRVGIVAVLFPLQIFVSHLWLARFRFGPAEWLWRSLTYGEAQPMRRAPAASPPAEAPQA